MSNLSKAERRAAAQAANAARLQANAAQATQSTPATAPAPQPAPADQQSATPAPTEPVVQQTDAANQAGDQQQTGPGDAATSQADAGAAGQQQGSTDDQQQNDGPADQQGQQDGAGAGNEQQGSGDDQQGQQQPQTQSDDEGKAQKVDDGPLVATADEPTGPVIPDGDTVTVVTVHTLKFSAEYTEPGTTLQLKREMALRLLATGAVRLP